MIDLGRFLRPGDGVWWGQAAAEPRLLVDELLDQADSIGRVRAFCGLTWNERLTTALPDALEIVSYGALGALRRLALSGRLDIVPCHYSALSRLFAERRLPCDVGFVQVSPPDRNGECSLGLGVDFVADAIAHTPILIAEINEQMRPTIGTDRIPLSRFAATVETNRGLVELPARPPDSVEQSVARNVAALVENGDTVQIGVGALPTAVLDCLADHEDLGVHSGMISDGILRLVDDGVVTGDRKELDTGFVVAGTALGSGHLYDRMDHPALRFRATSYTHAPGVLAQLHSFVSINSAIEIDLSGQVGAEVAGGAYVGAVGGQVDFSHAAATTGARSIIALRSTFDGETTIRPSLLAGVVTTSRSDVDVVVTEHGVAHLHGRDLAERARALVAVAAPQHREELERAIVDRKLAV